MRSKSTGSAEAKSGPRGHRWAWVDGQVCSRPSTSADTVARRHFALICVGLLAGVTAVLGWFSGCSNQREARQAALQVDVDHLPRTVIRPVRVLRDTAEDGTVRFYEVNDVEISPGGRIFITDRKAPGVAVLDTAGRVVRRTYNKGMGPKEFLPPLEVAVGDSYVYVLDKGNVRVQILDFELRYVSSFPVPAGIDHIGFLASPPTLVLGGLTPWDRNIVHLVRLPPPIRRVRSFREREPSRGQLSYLVLNSPYVPTDGRRLVAVQLVHKPYVELFDRSGKRVMSWAMRGSHARHVEKNLGSTAGGRYPSGLIPFYCNGLAVDSGTVYAIVRGEVVCLSTDGTAWRFTPIRTDTSYLHGTASHPPVYTNIAVRRRLLVLNVENRLIEIYRLPGKPVAARRLAEARPG